MGKRRRRKKTTSAQSNVRRMLINVIDHGEIRVVIAGPDGLEDVYIENSTGEFVHGNLFKGKVDNIEPNLQAAFVDIGAEKNGFLHTRDVIPPFGGYDGILKRRRRKAPKDPHKMQVDEMLYDGQEVLVQITREAVSTKGPSLTTFVSLPGRYLVLMPSVKKRGVSRKITDEKERDELKKALEQLDPPKDMGFIIRTAGMGKGRDELQRDLDYLTRLWEAICERAKKVKGPAPIYQESDLVIRAIRDYFNETIDELVIDAKDEFGRAEDFLDLIMPEYKDRLKLYDGSDPIFHHYKMECEIDKLFSRSVRLKSGGELVIEQTEAMVTIDINTGSFLKGGSSRDMILQLNKEAAKEVARQLRLRDMGGLIMIDFIDMDTVDDRRAVENLLRQEMEKDRARVTMLPISALGVMEMTRQRVRKSLRGAHYNTCPFCKGTGIIKNTQSLGAELVRRVHAQMDTHNSDVVAYLHPSIALDIANELREKLVALEEKSKHKVKIKTKHDIGADEIVIEPFKQD